MADFLEVLFLEIEHDYERELKTPIIKNLPSDKVYSRIAWKFQLTALNVIAANMLDKPSRDLAQRHDTYPDKVAAGLLYTLQNLGQKTHQVIQSDTSAVHLDEGRIFKKLYRVLREKHIDTERDSLIFYEELLRAFMSDSLKAEY